MLSIRKRQRQHWDNMKVLASFNQAAKLTYQGNKLTPAQIAFLSAVHLETLRSNDFCRLSVAIGMIGKNLIGWTGIKKLLDLGLLQTPVYGRYVVSVQGEYYLRTIEAFCARIINNSAYSTWKKIRGVNDQRLKYVRGYQKTHIA